MKEGIAMKRPLVLLALLVLGLTTHAETFLGVTSATNRFLIGTNEAVLIRTFVQTPLQFLKDGSNHFISILGPVSPPIALVGPAELVSTNPTVITFARIPTNGLQTIILPPANGTNFPESKFSLSPNKSIRFFFPLGSTRFRFDRGTNSYTGAIFAHFRDYGSLEVTGPLDVTLFNTDANSSAVASYAETEEALLVPQGIIQGPTGAFQIAVEKSSNLINWSPAILQDIRDDQKAFYRLRIAK